MERLATANPDEIRALVREGYNASSAEPAADELAARIGYTSEQIASLPAGANLGFGCGNPVALADPRPGEVIVDLGSGAGVDVFLAARAVGPTGRAIGIDMTPHMLEQAQAAAERSGLENVELHEATIEALPLEDASVDVVISNGVINLSPERERVFGEAFRVLRHGGRLAIADLATGRPVPPELAPLARRVLGNLLPPETYPDAVRGAGFRNVEIPARLPYGPTVLARHVGFLAAAKDAGASEEVLARFFEDLASLLIRARK